MTLGCALLAPIACGGDDATPGEAGGSTGSGGTGATGGSSGAGGSGGADTDASGVACGGFASLHCPDPDTMFCDYDAKVVCGQGDMTGICRPRPSECTQECTGVCGCDGKFYCNACLANQAGTDVHPSTTCSDAGH
jgi:hypothetical protein